MSKEKMEEIVKAIMASNRKWTFYYDTTYFYYMALKYPDLSISDCVDILDTIRHRLDEAGRKEGIYEVICS